MEPESRAALTATRVLIETESDDFAPLVERIAELRVPRRGAPPLWVRRLTYWTDRDLAAAILYHLVRARLWIEPHDAEDAPYFSTIGTALGADLVGPDTADRDEPMKIGCTLLGIARQVGIITIPPAEGRRGRRVELAEATFERLKRIINGGVFIPVLRRVLTLPPAAVKTQKPHEMLISRPAAPPRVVEAANKIQGTAWRINRAILKELDSPRVRLAKPDLQGEWILGEAHDLASLERFYFPVYTDFRGRIYQRGRALTYTGGNDYARGLLEFADGEFLNDEGRGWLTWHMAQMWGHKDDWPKSADGKPNLQLGDGGPWLREAAKLKLIERWQDAKHPAQFLAAARAVVDASEGRPVHLPVRVDASCSGLQHLALLSADANLARLVNLWGDNSVDRRMRVLIEASEDDDFYRRIAEATGFERAHVKAVIVPMLYGAGPSTSAEGLAEKRKQRMSKRQREDAEKVRGVAEELAPRAFGLLRWFKEIASAHNEADLPVRWTTPSGFQVVQDYRYIDKNPTRPDRQVKMFVDGEWINPVKRFYTEDICAWQQIISMPSSIVHSLDATLLTEIVAGSGIGRWGVIHDAFAVPANRVWELLDKDNPRAMRAVYEPDRLAEWVAAWRADGAPMEPSVKLLRAILGRDARGPLPAEMLGGLRTLG